MYVRMWYCTGLDTATTTHNYLQTDYRHYSREAVILNISICNINAAFTVQITQVTFIVQE